MPHHLGEDLEGLLPPQGGELAVLDLCLHGHAYEDGDAHTSSHALLYGLYALLFEGAILGFPLVAGWVITRFGYKALFSVLLAFAVVQVTIAWWPEGPRGRKKCRNRQISAP